MSLDGNTLSIILTIVSVIVGVVATIIVAKRFFYHERYHQASIAAAQISGLAQVIQATHDRTVALGTSLDQLLSKADGAGTRKDGPLAEMLELNRQLTIRSYTRIAEKRAIGQYIKRNITPRANLVVDCGTTTAWAFYEIARDGPELGMVVTNNIFVAMIVADVREALQSQNPAIVEELASRCQVLGGTYFPSYGGILDVDDGSIAKYLETLNSKSFGYVLMGATSFRVDNGPHARSGANKRFKAALLRYVSEHSQAKLIIVIEPEKLGITKGEPCDMEMWQKLRKTSRTEVVVALPNAASEGEAIDPEVEFRINEVVRVMQASGDRFRLTFIDIQGRPIIRKKAVV